MDKYKKYIQIAVIAVAAIWIFCIVFVICVKSKTEEPTAALSDVPTITETPVETFSPENIIATTDNPSETTTVPYVSIDGNNVTTSVSASVPQWKIDEDEKSASATTSKTETKTVVPTEKKDIINAYITAVNKLKNANNFTLVKTDNLSVTIDDVTGGSLIRSKVQSIINEKTDNTPKNYAFSAGKTADGKTPNDVVAPLGKQAALNADDVVSATAKADSNGSYTVTINLGKQKQTLDSSAAAYSTSMEVLSLDNLGLSSSMTVSSMNVTYGNSSITAKIDKDGRITSMKHYLEVTEADGTGKLALVSATVKMHGSFTSNYKITY